MKSDISMPLRLIFSEPGVNMFIKKKKPLKKYHMADNKIGYGISVPRSNSEFIQKMIYNGYIWKLELSTGQNGKAQDRKDFIELTRSIGNTMLFRQYYHSLRKEIFASDFIRGWNRNNPSKPLDAKTKINPNILEAFLSANHGLISQMKDEIFLGVNDHFKFHPEMKTQEKQNIQILAGKFIQSISPTSWFLLNIHKNTSGYYELLASARRRLANYLDKTIIAEYLSLLLVELIVFLRPELFRANPENPEGESTICFVFTSKGWQDDRVRLDIHIKDSVMLQKNAVQKAISDRSNDMNSTMSLKQFYERAENNIAYAGLGLYYLSYLKEACNLMDIYFQSTVSHMPGMETEINISLRL